MTKLREALLVPLVPLSLRPLVGLSAPQYSTGTTYHIGTTDSMCWYSSVPLVSLVSVSMCQRVSLHASTLLVPHVQSLVPLTLCVGTTRYSCYPWYHSLCASGSLCTPVLYWYHMFSLWYYWLYVLVPLVPLSLCAIVSLCTPVLYWYHMFNLWYHLLYVLVPLGTLGTPGTTLFVPMGLSAPHISWLPVCS